MDDLHRCTDEAAHARRRSTWASDALLTCGCVGLIVAMTVFSRAAAAQPSLFDSRVHLVPEKGVKVIELHPHTQQFDAGDPRVLTLVGRAGELGLIVMMDNANIVPNDNQNLFNLGPGSPPGRGSSSRTSARRNFDSGIFSKRRGRPKLCLSTMFISTSRPASRCSPITHRRRIRLDDTQRRDRSHPVGLGPSAIFAGAERASTRQPGSRCRRKGKDSLRERPGIVRPEEVTGRLRASSLGVPGHRRRSRYERNWVEKLHRALPD